jgi:hypothetical protein
MLNREFNNKESLVLAVKHRYTNLGVATKIVRSKDGKVWAGCDGGGSVQLAITCGNVFKIDAEQNQSP